MSTAKEILKVGLAAQAANLAISNLKKKKKKHGLVGQGITYIFGTSMIQAQSQMIGGFD